jgi:hypothetical protein
MADIACDICGSLDVIVFDSDHRPGFSVCAPAGRAAHAHASRSAGAIQFFIIYSSF